MKDDAPFQPDNNTQDTTNQPSPTSFDAPREDVASSPVADPDVEPATHRDTPTQSPTSDFNASPAEAPALTVNDTTSASSEGMAQPTSQSTEPIVANSAFAQPEPSPAPQVSSSDVPQPVTSAPVGGGNNGKKKKLIIAGIITGALVLIGGIGVAAYNLWYQNPEKVISDALVNSIQADSVIYDIKSDFSFKNTQSSSSPENMQLEIKGKNSGVKGEADVRFAMKYNGKDYEITGSGLTDEDANVYVKVNDVKKMISQLLGESGAAYSQLPSYITTIIDKVDSKWIRIAAEDFNTTGSDFEKTQTCFKDAVEKLRTDDSLSKELGEVYKDNKFVLIDKKLPAENGSLGYQIKFDRSKQNEFAKAANETAFLKELQKCDKEFKLSTDAKDSTSTDDFTLELWVDRWSHQFTKISLVGSEDEVDGSMTVEPTFNEPITVTPPKDYVPFSELKTDIENATTQYMMSMTNQYYSSSSSAMKRQSTATTF